jgi:hypothetical protein
MNKIFENQKVKITTACSVAAVIAAWAVADTRWKVNMHRDVQEIGKKQDEDGWHRDDMAKWMLRTEIINRQAGWRGAGISEN